MEAVHTVDIATHPDHAGAGSSELSQRGIAALRETRQFGLGLPNEMSRSNFISSWWARQSAW